MKQYKSELFWALLVILVPLLVWWITQPLWCDHIFERINEDKATCEEAGTVYYKCKLCRTKKEELIDPLGHDMQYDSVDIEEIGESVYRRVIYVCERCGHKDASEIEYCGSQTEYSAKMEAGIWLITDGSYGMVLDTDNAIVRYIDESNYYRILGTAYDPFTKSNHLVEAFVELNSENAGNVFWASIDSVVVLDEERLYESE